MLGEKKTVILDSTSIFMPGYFVSKMMDAVIDWKFVSSDHASILVRLNLNNKKVLE